MADKKKKGKQKDDRQKAKKRKQEEHIYAAIPAATETPSPLPVALPTASDTENAILDAVLACIAQYGIGGLTTRRIAAEAGVNEVTIFRRFGSKDALVQALFQREAQRIEGAALGYTGDLEADLTRIVRVFVEATERRQGLLPMLLNAVHTDGGAKSAASHSLAAFGAVAQVLARYMQEGALRAEAPERALAALIGPIVFGALLQPLALGAMPDLDTKAHVSGYLRGRESHARHE